ncbi:hypothetical protein AAC03nite_03310 [Alicyclobacillus acidoterrestris]|nr:hypothetical protein AAC03nite_03310 [Alicyclobacillus acidoterrestris]
MATPTQCHNKIAIPPTTGANNHNQFHIVTRVVRKSGYRFATGIYESQGNGTFALRNIQYCAVANSKYRMTAKARCNAKKPNIIPSTR